MNISGNEKKKKFKNQIVSDAVPCTGLSIRILRFPAGKAGRRVHCIQPRHDLLPSSSLH